ncbi:MAG: uridine kinase [Gemmataceae bacterium]
MFVIGVGGGTGSGKSTLVAQLLERVGDRVAMLPHDAYYRNRTDMAPEIRDALNFDHPDSLESDLFVRHIDALRRGETVEQPTYDFSAHTRRTQTRRVEPKPVLLVEGILLFAVPALLPLLNLKVFVDTPADLRILRRLLRDTQERGRTPVSVVEQYLATVRPMHQQFVEPGRQVADVIVPWEYHNPTAVDLIATRILAELAKAI